MSLFKLALVSEKEVMISIIQTLYQAFQEDSKIVSRQVAQAHARTSIGVHQEGRAGQPLSRSKRLNINTGSTSSSIQTLTEQETTLDIGESRGQKRRRTATIQQGMKESLNEDTNETVAHGPNRYYEHGSTADELGRIDGDPVGETNTSAANAFLDAHKSNHSASIRRRDIASRSAPSSVDARGQKGLADSRILSQSKSKDNQMASPQALSNTSKGSLESSRDRSSDLSVHVHSQTPSDSSSLPRIPTNNPTLEASQATTIPPLRHIDYSLSNRTDQRAVAKARDEYYHRLPLIDVQIRRRNQLHTVNFTPSEAVDCTNFFFVEMIVDSGVKRLQQLITGYTDPNALGVTPQHISKADKAAEACAKQPLLQNFFLAFKNQPESLGSKKTAFTAVSNLISKTDLCRSFNALLNASESSIEGTSTRKFLKEAGFETRTGVGYKSVIREYLCATLEILPDVLDNAIKPTKVIQTLFDTLGPGILVILPARFLSCISDWGHSKTQEAIKLLYETLPELITISRLLQHKVYDCIREGRPIQLDPTLLTTKGPLLETLQNASYYPPNRSVTTVARAETVDTEDMEE